MSERRPAALPLRAEIGRQLRRRRTQGIFLVLTVLPLILVLAFWLGDDDSDSGQRGFVDLAQESGANLTVFTLFASTSFLLIVIVALFAGDTVPSEASWSSLRYLLAAPVRRERLLRQKLIVAGLSSVVALIFLPAWTLLIGGLAYGWGPMIGPTSPSFTPSGSNMAMTAARSQASPKMRSSLFRSCPGCISFRPKRIALHTRWITSAHSSITQTSK